MYNKNQWFNQNRVAFLQCINDNPKKDKFAYIDHAKKDFKVYRFKHDLGRAEDSIYVLVLSKENILYRRKDKRYQKRYCRKTKFADFRESFKEQMAQSLTDEKISSLVKNYARLDMCWRYNRVKVERAFLAVKKINNKLLTSSEELCIKKRGGDVNYLKREIYYMQMFNVMYRGYKPQWLPLWLKCKDEHYGYARILMKYFGENLSLVLEEMQNCNNNIRKTIVYAIAVELKKIHDEDVVHGDLKPDNILMNKNKKVKIIDYDNTGKEGRDIGDGRIQRYIELEYFYAPLFMFDKSITKYTKAFDIFSLGVIIWQIYGGNSYCYRKILSSDHKTKKYDAVRKKFADLVRQTLQKEAKVDDKITNLVIRMTTAKHDDVPNIDEVIKNFASS